MSNLPQDSNKRKGSTLQNLIDFIESALKTFIQSNEFKTKYLDNPDAGEDTLTSALRGYLDLESRKLKNDVFLFETQPEQKKSKSKKGKKRTIDVAVATSVSNGLYIFCLEAKWINAVDYVTKDTGAIKRFKKCEHGLSSANTENATPLPINGIVAYVESGNLTTHFSNINQQIQNLSNQFSLNPDIFGLLWKDTELLKQKYPNQFDNHTSQHTRVDDSELTLHHFWVYVTPTASNQSSH